MRREGEGAGPTPPGSELDTDAEDGWEEQDLERAAGRRQRMRSEEEEEEDQDDVPKRRRAEPRAQPRRKEAERGSVLQKMERVSENPRRLCVLTIRYPVHDRSPPGSPSEERGLVAVWVCRVSTLVPGESHGHRSLAGHHPWGHTVGYDWAQQVIEKEESISRALSIPGTWRPSPRLCPQAVNLTPRPLLCSTSGVSPGSRRRLCLPPT